MNRTSILLEDKTQITQNLFEYKLRLVKVYNNDYDLYNDSNSTHLIISIVAPNDNTFKIYLKDLQHVLVSTDRCMAFDDNNLLK